MLRLPDEVLLQIALNLSGTTKNADPERNLLSLATTCKRLAPIAREALCHAPIVRSSKVHVLLETLFKYPSLQNKAKSLTIETKETRCEQVLPTPIPRLSVGLLRNCVQALRALPISEETYHWWVADLQVTIFKFHGPLICLLITMFPKLEELYLGGSVLFNLPLFRGLLSSIDHETEYGPYALAQTPNWNMPNLSCIMSILGPRLKILEFPSDLRLDLNHLEKDAWLYAQASDITKYFPALRHLMLPALVVIFMPCEDIIPRTLEALVLTNARFNDPNDWLIELAQSRKCFPSLRRVAVYHRYCKFPTEPEILDAFNAAEMEYFEYTPDCVLDMGHEFYHPWMYTPAEIDALEPLRMEVHEKENEILAAEIRAKVIAKQVEHARSAHEGLLAIRYLFTQASDLHEEEAGT
ncbi:hypothetical protein BKA66DRAFT_610374 [Pyrenochaeta sp. MPI-SDFR-AT-0127]|nr:hypothetical protein BKA66DRAFT_610374 [Pyrenochaeta sp. MPI-SDFR-AT-0127]